MYLNFNFLFDRQVSAWGYYVITEFSSMLLLLWIVCAKCGVHNNHVFVGIQFAEI